MQSTLDSKIHAGIIMDGNGRWATRLGLSRSQGHRAGVRAIRPIVEAAKDMGVGTLTLYAFSGDNWKRPPAEVAVLMTLLKSYLAEEIETLVAMGVRLSVIGRRDRISPALARRIEEAQARSASAGALHLRIAFDYSSRDAILDAARRSRSDTTREEFARLLTGGAPELDLVIRTGGEQRLSDFLLYECAYAELLFTARLWPDFQPGHLREALAEFRSRQRRFGAAPAERVAA
ncbi:di-trans,poly-cis-decaprenylcistransferase [Aureimonas sp. AU40]|uniref:di-trans,poly-cis-decaprenylcistransferase n=1 Tax=Aureimonas sp. AU40 TaxID=1637747 RepID=UPI0007806E77|nr:di-trans,poly-cis-decaprenylcistransferase [Aureimonas sp. AU40]